VHSQDVTQEQRAADEAIVRRELSLGNGELITFESEGWDSRVYLVGGGAAVFKFPRSPAVQARYTHEDAVLRALEQHDLPVLVPKVRWVGDEFSYLGYEGIPGARLSDITESLGTARRRDIGEAIGSFLQMLHAIDVDGAPIVSLDDEIAIYHEKFELATPVLRERFTPREFDTIARFMSVELPIELRQLGSDSRLCHGDLGAWNIIVGERDEIGVIDFGDTGYWDVSKDFSGRDVVYLEGALDSYGASPSVRAKAALRIKAFPILDLFFYVGKEDAAGVDMLLAEARTRLLTESTRLSS
jgi:aminoglycoside phosphotransferase (APT) family kinase protein